MTACLRVFIATVFALGNTACATTNNNVNVSKIPEIAPSVAKETVGQPDALPVTNLPTNTPQVIRVEPQHILQQPAIIMPNPNTSEPGIITKTTPRTNAANNIIPKPGITTDTTLRANSAENIQNTPPDIRSQYTGHDGPVPVIQDPVSCGKNKYEIRVDVDNVRTSKGRIVADLHDDVRENFLVGAKAVLRIWATAQKGRTSFCIPLEKPGTYAVAIYHDKNSNKQFDKNFLGIPKERFGMSNNPKFGTKAPKFEQVVIQVPETGTHLLIKLRKASDILGRQK